MGNAVVRVNGHSYEHDGALAEGGFATVVRVRRRGALFALKWTRGIADDAQLQRVLLEIQVQRKLQHPNVMRLVEAEVRVSDRSTGGRASPVKSGAGFAGWTSEDAAPRKEVLMVFPLYPRGTLQQHLEGAFQQKTAAFSEAECLRVFTLLVEAVLELQARGFAHRDIKPHNVLLTSTEPVEPILTDFGSLAPVKVSVSSALEALQLFEDAAQFCSAGYRAPELWETHSSTGLRGQVDNGKADVWSLGCLLYAMAFGPYSPFENATEGVLQLAIYSGNVRFPTDKTRFGEQFSPAFTDFILWMLTVSPLERPTIYQVLDRVDDLRAGRRRGSRGGSKRSLSLRRSISKKGDSFRVPGSDDWADFSAFNTEVGEASSPQSEAASVPSSTVSRSSWQVVSGNASVADSMTSPRSIRRLSSVKGDDMDQRRKLSLKGRQLLATALRA